MLTLGLLALQKIEKIIAAKWTRRRKGFNAGARSQKKLEASDVGTAWIFIQVERRQKTVTSWSDPRSLRAAGEKLRCHTRIFVPFICSRPKPRRASRKSGLLRGRDFSMKDLYSFHIDKRLHSFLRKIKQIYFGSSMPREWGMPFISRWRAAAVFQNFRTNFRWRLQPAKTRFTTARRAALRLTVRSRKIIPNVRSAAGKNSVKKKPLKSIFSSWEQDKRAVLF